MAQDITGKCICEACGKKFFESEQYAYYCGYYCSKECYETLFLNCTKCDQKNMTAKTNLKYHNEQLCDQCYMEKHNLGLVTILFK
jgi:hypothetical protein